MTFSPEVPVASNVRLLRTATPVLFLTENPYLWEAVCPAQQGEA